MICWAIPPPRSANAETGDLAPVILDALAEDRITTEHCQALALENDTARQVQVFEAACQSGWGGKPEVRPFVVCDRK
ncbi:hypothetical protein ECP030230812_5406 [Escherichia coli P0302308.12]|nr:hypothetical protein ECP030230812_5406 [Escherichia coli P0302308.12]